MYSILKAIWNGPFFIGPLTRPVSVGDVLLKVLEVLWRAALIGAVIALLLVLWIFLYIQWGNWQAERRESARLEMIDNIVVTGALPSPDCPSDGPLLLEIQNRNDFAIAPPTVRLEAWTSEGQIRISDSERTFFATRSIPGGSRLRICRRFASVEASSFDRVRFHAQVEDVRPAAPRPDQ